MTLQEQVREVIDDIIRLSFGIADDNFDNPNSKNRLERINKIRDSAFSQIHELYMKEFEKTLNEI